MLLEGIFLPLTTPFHPDGRLFLRKLQSNVERYSRTPAAGMLVLGEAGEAAGLTDRESEQVLTAAIAAAADEKVMLAAVGRASVSATLELAGQAAAAGYDAIVLREPAFMDDTAMGPELRTYFEAIADRAPLPVVLLSDWKRLLTAEMMAVLAGHPQVIGAIVSETSPDRLAELLRLTAAVKREVTVTSTFAAATGRMLRHTQPAGNFVSAMSLGGGTAVAVAPPRPAAGPKTRTKRVGFQVLAGSTGAMLEAWIGGASGALPRLAACAPQACCEVWQAFKDGDPALAAEKQQRVLQAGRLVEGWAGIAALKYGCDLNAYFGGRPRLPLLPLAVDGREAVERSLAGLKN